MTAGPATDPWTGGVHDERATCVLAPNPGPMTLEGTNTWVLVEPGANRAVVVDPGPLDTGHLDAVLAAAQVRDARVSAVLLTHGHPDHSEGARALGERARVPVRALDPAHRLGDEGLAGGDVVDVDGLVLRVLATPGHTGDSLSFHLVASGAVLTGDTVLGRGSTVVAHPDGRLGDYLASLDRLADLAEQHGATTVLPGHGPVLVDAAAAVAGYRRHRLDRLEQVRAALVRLGRPDPAPREVVELVYRDVPEVLWPYADLSVAAQLDYLRERAGA